MSGLVQAEQASIRPHQPLRLPARAHRVRKADRLHLHDLFDSLFCSRLLLLFIFLVVVQAGLYSQRREVIRN
jgi:hypothetical protein